MEAARKLENQTRFLLRVTRLWPIMTTVERQVLRGATTGVRVFSVDELTAITHDALECDEKLAIANALLESIEGKEKAIDDKKESSDKKESGDKKESSGKPVDQNDSPKLLTITVFHGQYGLFTVYVYDNKTIENLRSMFHPCDNLDRYMITNCIGVPYLEDKTLKEQGIRNGDIIYTKWWPQVNGV